MLEEGQKVFVYRNLTKQCWSVRDCKTRRVVAHLRCVTLYDVELKVSEAGRQRVLRERKKNVHAGAEGIFRTRKYHNSDCDGRIKYDPYKHGYFYHAVNGQIITGAQEISFEADGSVWST